MILIIKRLLDACPAGCKKCKSYDSCTICKKNAKKYWVGGINYICFGNKKPLLTYLNACIKFSF